MLNFMNHRMVKKLHLGYTSFTTLNVMTEQGFWFTVSSILHSAWLIHFLIDGNICKAQQGFQVFLLFLHHISVRLSAGCHVQSCQECHEVF